MTPDFWDRRKVLVTGHTGFKGSWLSIWLHRLGAQVTGYALCPPTEPSNFVASSVKDILAGHHIADIRDRDALRQAVESSRPDVIFHLAAQPIVRESYQDPHTTIDVNVVGVSCLLDVVRKLGRPCVVVVITSDKCYENREQVWGYREVDSMGGHDPYSASKGAAEIVAASYRRSFFLPERVAEHGVKLATCRAGNVIGGGDWAKDRIVADIARSLAAGQPIPVRRPDSIRPWQHVLEPLSGYLLLASRMLESDDPEWADAWNFGPANENYVPVRALVDCFCREWEGGAWEDCSDPEAPHETNILRLCIDKAVWSLGWRPKWGFDETILRTARWYRAFHDAPAERSMRKACEADIAAYEQSRPSNATQERQ